MTFDYLGSSAETRRSNLSGMASIMYQNDHQRQSGLGQVVGETKSDPYLLGRLMGSPYVNCPTTFSSTCKGTSTLFPYHQPMPTESKPMRGFSANVSTEEPIYVPGAYLVSDKMKTISSPELIFKVVCSYSYIGCLIVYICVQPSSCLSDKDGANDIYDFASKYRQQMRHQHTKMLMTPQG